MHAERFGQCDLFPFGDVLRITGLLWFMRLCGASVELLILIRCLITDRMKT